jgi:hypothetical protein
VSGTDRLCPQLSASSCPRHAPSGDDSTTAHRRRIKVTAVLAGPWLTARNRMCQLAKARRGQRSQGQDQGYHVRFLIARLRLHYA